MQRLEAEDSLDEALKGHIMFCSKDQVEVYRRLLVADLRILYGFYTVCNISQLNEGHFKYLRKHWHKKGNSPSTINSKLSAWKIVMTTEVMNKLFNETDVFKRAPERRQEQWWLHPDDEERLHEWLVSQDYCKFSEFIKMMTHQGLRVSEVSKLHYRHLLTDDLVVPGTKTSDAQATIPVYSHSRSFFDDMALRTQLGCGYGGSCMCFTFTPKELMDKWNECREFLNVSHIPTSTMKALRRSFAYRATKAGMPTAVLQKVMRHKSITTTERYLRIVGGGLLEDSRKYL